MKGQDENISRITEKRAAAKKNKEAREAAKLKKIWSREQALTALKELYLLSMEGTLEKTADKKSGEIEVKFNSSAASTATKAIETANKMLGYQKPMEEEPQEMAEGVAVEFLIDESLCE